VWAQDPYGDVRKISPPIGIRSPDRPDGSDSLYRLSHPDPNSEVVRWNGETKEELFNFYGNIFILFTKNEKGIFRLPIEYSYHPAKPEQLL
jgi:hypothetical protein